MPNTSQTAFDAARIPRPATYPFRAYRAESGWERLAALGAELSLAKGHTVYTSERPHYSYLVVEGCMAACTQSPEGTLGVSAFLLTGSLFLEPNCLSGVGSDMRYRALEPSKLVRIDAEVLAHAARNDAAVFRFVMESVANKLNAAHEQLREAKTLDVRTRVYLMLQGLARDCGERDGSGWARVPLKLTQQMMSDMLGVNRVTVNTALQDLYTAGAVRKEDGCYAVRENASAGAATGAARAGATGARAPREARKEAGACRA